MPAPFFWTVLCALILGGIPPIHAQGPPSYPHGCGPADELPNYMWAQYQEVPAWSGVADDGSLIQLYLALSGTWTIVRIDRGLACNKANGDDWEIPLPPMPGIDT